MNPPSRSGGSSLARGAGLRRGAGVVLEARDAVFDEGVLAGGGGVEMNLALRRGELTMLWAEDVERLCALADALTGLMLPMAGTVSFLGTSWASCANEQANRRRARIGRSFAMGAWLPDRSLLDNILLVRQHHSLTPTQTLVEEAAQLSARFGLPGVPSGALRESSAETLARAACIRALLGQPAMVVLEAPTDIVDEGLGAQLTGAIRNARDQGASVVWLTQSERVWYDTTLPVSQRFRLTNQALRTVDIGRRQRRASSGNVELTSATT